MQRKGKEFPASRVPKFRFSATLKEQEGQLKDNPLMLRMAAARARKAHDPHRPVYHFVNPENTLNDPNGLCFWQGRWHLFYQARPPEDLRLHWGHAVSEDLVHWKDLPYALYPGPENNCYSGTTLVEQERVVAMYHGTDIGNMVAVSSDPLLLNWEKLTGHAVIPFAGEGRPLPDYGVFDPCLWKKDGAYYALAAGIRPFRSEGRHVATEYLFRSEDLEHWEYLHAFVQGDRFTVLGDDRACPYFWPIGDRYILLFFSHLTGGQYLIGDYDEQKDEFVVDTHGCFNFGASFPGGVHAPTATPDGEGGIIVMFNMNPAKPTYRLNDYLQDFFGDVEHGEDPRDDGHRYAHDWDQMMTLPRRLTLLGRHDLAVQVAGDVESLRRGHRRLGRTVLPANEETVLAGLRGNAIELKISAVPGCASMFEVKVLRSPGKEEFTRICFYHRRGRKYREPLPGDFRSHGIMSTALSTPVRHESVLSIDTSCSSSLPDALSRPPESAPVLVEPGEILELRIFVDRSVVEVFVNDRQCVAARVYPGRQDSIGVSLLSRGRETEVLSVDCWQMENIYG